MLIAQRVLAEGGAEGKSFWETAYPILPHPGELIVGLIAFAVVYWVYASKVVPALEKAYKQRADAIEGGINRAEKAQAEAQAARDEYVAKLEEAREEATKIRESARAEASGIAADIRKKAADDAARLAETSNRQLEADRQQAMVSLRRDIGGLATTLAGRIVGESMKDSSAQSGVIDRFLAELEEASPADVRAKAGVVGANESALDRLTKRQTDEGQ